MDRKDSDMKVFTIGQVEDFPELLGREVRIGATSIAVFRTSEDRLFALDNHTPHKKGGTLTEAIVSGEYVYCPLRDLKIRLEDGVVQEPDTGIVETYPVFQTGNGEVRLVVPIER